MEIEPKLKTFLKDNMAILFVPLNPPKISNSKGHYFSRVSTFWDILYDSGIIVEKIHDLIKADEQVFGDNRINYNKLTYGICDLVSIVETDSTKVKPQSKDFDNILAIIKMYKPQIICLMHSKVRKAFIKGNLIPDNSGYGKVGEYRGSIIFSVPFPTGSSYSKEEITKYYKELRSLLDSLTCSRE